MNNSEIDCIINNAVYNKPQFINVDDKDLIFINKETVFDMLEHIKIKIVIKKDENLYYTQNNVMEDIIGWGKTRNEAVDDFVKYLDIYVHDYYDNFKVYCNTERGKRDMPYILKIICSKNVNSIKNMLVLE